MTIFGVTILEPTTTITDFILAAMNFYFGHMLFHKHSKTPDKNILDKRYNQFWALVFLFLGFGSLLGGLSHGFPDLKNQYTFVAKAWPLTVMSIGIASFYLLLTISIEYFPRFRNFLFFFAYFKLTAFILLMFGYPGKYFGEFETISFRLVIYDYLPVLLLLLSMNVLDLFKSPSKKHSSKIMCLGILISIVGTCIQVSKISLHKHFNHNDLYHVIQMVAIYLMYRSITLKRIGIALHSNL